MTCRSRDRGAAAVEFALVLPLLFLLTMGIIAFGHVFHVQTVLDNAARDAVRIFTLQEGPGAAEAAQDAAIASASPSVAITASNVFIPASCEAGTNARVTIELDNFQMLGGFFPAVDLTGTGTMRCNG